MNWQAVEVEDTWENEYTYPPLIHRVDYIDSESTLNRGILIARMNLTDKDRRGHRVLNYPLLHALKGVFQDLCIPNGITCGWNGGMLTAVMKVDDSILQDLHAMSDEYSDTIARILDFDEGLVPGITATQAIKVLNISRFEFSKMTSSGKIIACGVRYSDGQGRVPHGVRTPLYAPISVLRLLE